MTSQEVDYSNYYDINGDKICDNKGERIFVHFLGLHIQDLETGEVFPFRDDTTSSEDDDDIHEYQDNFKDFSYSLFMYNIFLCIISKMYDFFYYVKNREL